MGKNECLGPDETNSQTIAKVHVRSVLCIPSAARAGEHGLPGGYTQWQQQHEDEMGCSCTHLDPGRGFSSEPGRPWWAAPSHFPRGYWLSDRHLGRNAGAGTLITDTCPFWANVGQKVLGIGRVGESRKQGLIYVLRSEDRTNSCFPSTATLARGSCANFPSLHGETEEPAAVP